MADFNLLTISLWCGLLIHPAHAVTVASGSVLWSGIVGALPYGVNDKPALEPAADRSVVMLV